MIKLIISIAVLLIALIIYISFCVGYIKGMKNIIDMDNKYDYEFRKLITDFVTEKYVRKTEKENNNERNNCC